MRIAVIGAGIVGVTTALELVSHGHEVVVFEKNTGIAQEASFATSGFIGPGLIHSWTVPQMAAKVIQKMMFSSDAYSYHGLNNIPFKWLWQWSSACTHTDFKLKIESLQRLAFYSQEVMKGIAEQYGFQFELSKGCILVCRQEKEMKQFQLQMDLMTANGIAFKKLNQPETRLLEPALSEEIQFFGSILFPNDEVANCRQFALLAKQQAALMGAEFRTGQEVLPLSPESSKQIQIPHQPKEDFDLIVVCAGIHSKSLLKYLPIKLPSLAVHGYSLSAAVREHIDAPVYGIVDAKHHVSIAKTGQRIRVSGITEIGNNKKPANDCVQLLYKTLNDWFPGAAKTHEAVQVWRGTRDMLTDGLPILGHSGVPGIWLNTGHGNHGWASSCGSARAIADMVSGRGCEIDLKGLGIERF